MTQTTMEPETAVEGGADAIRPFRVHFPDEALADLKRRIKADTVARAGDSCRMHRKACSSRSIQKLARYWATDYDWRKVEARTERLASVHHRDRWAGHSLHPRSFEA